MSIFKQGNVLQNIMYNHSIIFCLEDQHHNGSYSTCLCLNVEGKIFEKQIVETLSEHAWCVIAQIK
jgi:hypothetical protein